MACVHIYTSAHQQRHHVDKIRACVCVPQRSAKGTSSCLSSKGFVLCHTCQQKHMVLFAQYFTLLVSTAWNLARVCVSIWVWVWGSRRLDCVTCPLCLVLDCGVWQHCITPLSVILKCNEGGSEVRSYRWNHTRYAQPQHISEMLTRHQNWLLRKILSGCVFGLIYSVRLCVWVCVLSKGSLTGC